MFCPSALVSSFLKVVSLSAHMYTTREYKTHNAQFGFKARLEIELVTVTADKHIRNDPLCLAVFDLTAVYPKWRRRLLLDLCRARLSLPVLPMVQNLFVNSETTARGQQDPATALMPMGGLQGGQASPTA